MKLHSLHTALVVVGIGFLCEGGFARDTHQAITITPADFKVSRDKLVENLSVLETMATTTVSTADYARRYRKFQEDLSSASPPFDQWESQARERVRALPEPAESGWEALRIEESGAQARREAQIQDAQRASELQTEQQRERLKQQNAQTRLELEARLKEAQARESEARADYYEDSYPAFYYRPWIGYPGRPRPSRPPNPNENRYYGTKPNLPNNYTPSIPPQRR